MEKLTERMKKNILKDYPGAVYYGLPEDNGNPTNTIDFWLFDKDFNFIADIDRRKYF